MRSLPPSLWPRLWWLECDLPWPPISDAEVDRFIKRVAAEEMLALLEAAENVPSNIVAVLSGYRALLRLMQRRSERLHNVTIDVCGKLADEPCILLKGADYRYELYASPDLRPMRDIDVLVTFSRMDDIERLLEKQNLVRIFPGGAITRVAGHHERSFVGADFAIDLHHSFVQRSRHSVDYDSIFRERQQFRIGNVTTSRMSPVHSIVAHCLMMARDEYVVPMRSYLDLWLLLERHGEHLSESARLAAHWRCERAFYSSLELLSQMFPESKEMVRSTNARVLSAPTRWYLDRMVLPDARRAFRQRGRAIRIWRKLNLLDTPYHLARFGADHLHSALAGLNLERRRRVDTVERRE